MMRSNTCVTMAEEKNVCARLFGERRSLGKSDYEDGEIGECVYSARPESAGKVTADFSVTVPLP